MRVKRQQPVAEVKVTLLSSVTSDNKYKLSICEKIRQDTTNKQKGARALFTGKEAKSTNYGRFYEFEIIKKSL